MAPQSSALLLESGLDACITSLSERQLVAASSAFTGPYVQIDCQVQKISFEFHKRGSSPKSFREGGLRQPALALRSWYGRSVERTSRCCYADAGDSAQDRSGSPFPRLIRGNSPFHGFGFFLLLVTIVLLTEWMRASLIAALLSGSGLQKTSAMRCWRLRRAGEQDRIDDETVFISERN